MRLHPAVRNVTRLQQRTRTIHVLLTYCIGSQQSTMYRWLRVAAPGVVRVGAARTCASGLSGPRVVGRSAHGTESQLEPAPYPFSIAPRATCPSSSRRSRRLSPLRSSASQPMPRLDARAPTPHTVPLYLIISQKTWAHSELCSARI